MSNLRNTLCVLLVVCVAGLSFTQLPKNVKGMILLFLEGANPMNFARDNLVTGFDRYPLLREELNRVYLDKKAVISESVPGYIDAKKAKTMIQSFCEAQKRIQREIGPNGKYTGRALTPEEIEMLRNSLPK